MTNKEFELQKAAILEGVKLGQLTQEEANHAIEYTKGIDECIGCRRNDRWPHGACCNCER